MKQSTTSRTTDSANAGWLQRGVRRYVNRYTGQPFELLPDKHPRGGLYIYMKNLETGETATFHRGNLKTSFSPNDKVSDGGPKTPDFK